MNKQIENKIINLFIEQGKPYGMGRIPDNYSVNCRKNKDYARDVFETLQNAFAEKIKRGDGFTIGCGWKGPSNHSTADMGATISDCELVKLIVAQ